MKSIGLKIVLGFAFLFTVSCSKDKAGYEALVPADASFVVAVDVKSVLGKSRIWQNPRVKAEIEGAVENGASLVGQLLKFGIKNPEISGVDFVKDVYVFESGIFPDETLFAFAVKKPKRLRMLLEKSGEMSEIKESGGRVWAEFPQGVFLFDDTRGLFVSRQEGEALPEDELWALFSQGREESFAGSPYFRYLESGNDMGLLLTMEYVKDEFPDLDLEELAKDNGWEEDLAGDGFGEYYVYAGLDFGKKEMGISLEYIPLNPKTEEYMEQVFRGLEPIKGRYLPSLGADVVAFATWGMDGDGWLSQLERMPRFETMKARLPAVSKLASLKGDCLLSLSSSSLLPGLTCLAQAPDSGGLDFLDEYLGGIPLDSNRYKAKKGPLPVYYGWEEETLYLGTSSSVDAAVESSGQFTDKFPWAEKAEGCCFYLGFDAETAMPLLSSDILQTLGFVDEYFLENAALVQEIFEQTGMGYIEFMCLKPFHFSLVFHVAEGQSNPFALLCDYVFGTVLVPVES